MARSRSGSLKPRFILLLPFGRTFCTRSIRLGSGWLIAVLLGCLVIAGCTTPVGVERADPQAVYRVLTRWDLTGRFAADPEAALAALHSKVADGVAGSDEVFALAELSYQHAEQT